MIDFHCHLDLYPDPAAVAAQCRALGMYVLSVTTTPSAWKGTAALSSPGDRIRTALGLHPQLAHERLHELALFDRLVQDTRYVGEVGLDGAPEFRAHWEDQITAFTHVLDSCRGAGGRILSVHSRRSSSAVLDSLESHAGYGTAVLHWFSGGRRDLSRAVALGCWFSVGPAMLRSARGRSLAASIPPGRVLTETDGPFGQFGGRAPMPWDVVHALAALGSLWELSHEGVRGRLLDNLEELVSS